MSKLQASLSEWCSCPVIVYPETDNVQRGPAWCGHQRDSEFHRFVDLLVAHKCSSILFIGVADGGNQLYIARRYSALGWKCRMLMVDIRVNLGLAGTLHAMAKECPNVDATLLVANSQHLTPGDLGTFDAAFVDGDHGYPQTLHDVRLCDAVVTQFTGAHDVTDKGSEIPCAAAWQVLKQGRRVEEFFTDNQMGIGVLYKDASA